MTTIDGRWILLAALLGALLLIVPAVTAGGFGTPMDSPVFANESTDSSSDWADGHSHGDDWDHQGPHHDWNDSNHSDHSPHHDWNDSNRSDHGPHHDWSDSNRSDHGPHHDWDATEDETENGTNTSNGNGRGHGYGHGC
jgi:hypothetical protein